MKINRITFYDRAYLIFLEGFIYRKEAEPELLAKAIFSLLVSVNLFNLFIFLSLILNEEIRFERSHVIMLVIASLIFNFIYFSRKRKKEFLFDFIEKRDDSVRKKSFILSIIIYLVSFGTIILLAFVRYQFL